jgi:two-component system cell cycle sensor histidine kinase PleC
MLGSIVDSSVVLAQRRINEKHQTLVVELEDDLPLIWADELRLKQVLINLLSNSSKFTPNGGTVSIRIRRAADSVVEISVSDTGIGMTAEEISLAMKPFTQVRSSHNRTEEGTGLGLPIAKALIVKHGGRFEITSTPGTGTTVSITLKTADGQSGAIAA